MAMNRIAVGGLAAGTFALGLLVGIVSPGALGRADHERLMLDHMAAMAPMMNAGAMMGAGAMMDGGGMPMAGGGMSMAAGTSCSSALHASHHARMGATQ
jgi:hypothetical protein